MVEERGKEQEVNVSSDVSTDNGHGNPTPPPPKGDSHTTVGRRRLAELVRSIGSDLSLLARQQSDLAKQELGEMAATKAKGAGLLAAAGVLALFMIGFLGIAAAEGLDLVLPRWAAFLIVGGVFVLLAAIAVLIGRSALRTSVGPERTKQTVKEDVEWAKQQLRR
jgi:hypothetical protein